VGTVFEVGKNVDFVDSSFFQFGELPELFGLDTLDGDFLLCLEVDGFEDAGVNPRAKFMLKRIIFDNLSHLSYNIDFEIFIITSLTYQLKYFV
jgi:hypothetical protein